MTSPWLNKTWPDYVDFICIGAGIGGLVAAIRAHDSGLSVLVLEASDRVGGVGAYSGGIVWAPGNHLQEPHEREQDQADGLAYLGEVGGPGLTHDRGLRRALVQGTATAVQYLADHGGLAFRRALVPDQLYGHSEFAADDRTLEASVPGEELGPWLDVLRETPFQPPWLFVSEAVAHLNVEDGYRAIGPAELKRRKEHNLLVRGRGLVGGLLRAAVARGIDIRVHARATRLHLESGAVTGVELVTPQGTRNVRARGGVLLATGSYGNAPWRAELEGLPAVHDQGPPITWGDGITLSDPTPAALVRAGHGFTVLGYESRTRVHPGTAIPLHIPLWDCLGFPHSLVVNGAGRRFGDESHYTSFSGAINQYSSVTRTYPNFPSFLIMDDQFRRNGYPLGEGAAPWPEDSLVSSETLSGLADALGVSHDLLGTVEGFNADVELGRDSQFGRGSILAARTRHGDPGYAQPNLGAIRQPPFWGLRLTILSAGLFSHGLAISPNGEVLDRGGEVVPGLFATGNAVAYTELPGGYENGVANARNICYAFNAATVASRSLYKRGK